MKKTMNLADIRIDGGTQSRVAINTEAVGDYAKAMLDGDQLPPLLVYFDGAANWLADGFHRFHASRKVGLKAVEVEVVQGTLQDAKLYAYGANKSHGLRRTNKDKRKAVLGMLEDFGSWSDNKIAKHVGVSQPFVGAVRSSLITVISETPTRRTYTTKHGTEATMNTGGVGKGGRNEEEPSDAQKPAEKAQEPAAQSSQPELVDQLRDINAELLDANDELTARLAVASMDATPEERQMAADLIAELRATVAGLERDLRAVKVSRDGLMVENAELKKQVAYWRKRAEKEAA